MLSSLFATIALPLELFARAGGGGSGGSSSGGEGGGILFLLGYIPMHFVGALLRRAGSKNHILKIVLDAIGWIIAVIYSIMWTYLWGGLGVMIGLVSFVGMAAGLYDLFTKIKQSKRVKRGLSTAARKDKTWTEEAIIQHAREVFVRYQADWSARNTQAMQSYLTPYYHQHASLLVAILQHMGRQDNVQNPHIIESVIVDMNDAANDDNDWVTIGFTAKANDMLIDTATDKKLFTDTNKFTEYWTFQRSGDTWLLARISQASSDTYVLNRELRQFAEQQGYYYSLDMGWLFIPQRGQLFTGASFGVSDINNHIVGMYNNELLVQLYTYSKIENAKPYVIAQVNVPQHYGNIVVRRKKALHVGIRGLEKVQTEWTQFNDKYEVYASAPEQVTSFELLNPTYMEQLEALDFEVNIEVVDNVIYLYTDERKASLAVYQTMLDLVNKAFKELRL